jgi:hypothetical protein
VSFPWLERTPSSTRGPAARLAAQLREIGDRAAIYFRLGFSAEEATRRLAAAVAWEHESHGKRPTGLSDTAIAAKVKETYARRPSGAL